MVYAHTYTTCTETSARMKTRNGTPQKNIAVTPQFFYIIKSSAIFPTRLYVACHMKLLLINATVLRACFAFRYNLVCKLHTETFFTQ